MNEYFIKRPLKEWWLTALLIALNVGLFLVQFLNGVSPLEPSVHDLIVWGADFAPLTLGTENWRLLSSMFLHIGVVHLAVNMWALYLLGIYAEFYYGRIWYLGVYLLAGIAGNLVTNFINLYEASLQSQKLLLLQAQPFIPSVSAGASGAIMGVGAALLVAAIWPKPELPVPYRLNKNGLIMLMLLNLGIGIFLAGINNAAHLGGFVAGLMLAISYRSTISLTTPNRYLWQAGLMIASMGLTMYADYWLLEDAKPLQHVWHAYFVQ